MTRSINGHIRVGIDLDNKGAVEFFRDEAAPLNLKGSWMNRVKDTIPLGTTTLNPDVQHLYYPQYQFDRYWTTDNPDLQNYIDALNPFGNELTRVSLDAGESATGTAFTRTVDNDSAKYAVSPSTEYTVWMWISSDTLFTEGGGDFFNFIVNEYDSGDSFLANNSNAITITTVNHVTAVSVTFTTNASTDYLSVGFIRNFTSSPDQWVVFVHGIALFAGDVSTEPIWNAGSANAHLDDITAFVQTANGSIGKSEWEQLLFNEGTVSLTVNNADRRFSPEYVSSPYYGLLKPHQRMHILFAGYDGVYRLLWAGWTHQFMIETGQWTDNRVTITGRQGRFLIEAQDPALLSVKEDISSADIINQMMDGGYEISTGPNDTTETIERVMEDYEQGVTVPILGTSYAGKAEVKDYAATLENVAELNGNYLFLTRYGRIFFFEFATIKDTIAEFLPFEYTIDAEYTYAPEDLYKEIIVNYDYYRNDDDIEMQGVDQTLTAGTTDFNFVIHPKYNDRPLIGDVILDVADFQPVNYSAVPAYGGASVSFSDLHDNIYTWYEAVAQNTTDLDYRLSLVSRASGFVWYADLIDQSYSLAGFADRALETLTYNNPLVTSPFMAETLAQLQKARRTNILSWFNSATLTNRNEDSLDFILKHTLGAVIYMQEYQTGNVPKHLCIIGEQWQYRDNYLQMTYNLAPTGGEVGNVCAAEFDLDIDGETKTVTVVSESEANSPILYYLWDFGDGYTTFDEEPAPHTYAENGSYTITLTIYTAYCTDTITHTALVALDPCLSDCLAIDFTMNDGCFTPFVLSGNDDGVYVDGVGWESVNLSSVNSVQIERTLSAPVALQYILIESNTAYTGLRRYSIAVKNGGSTVWTAGGVLDPHNHTGSGVHVETFDHGSLVTGDYIKLYVDVPSSSDTIYMTSVSVEDDSNTIIGEDC